MPESPADTPLPRRRSSGIDLLSACLRAGVQGERLDEKVACLLAGPAMGAQRFAQLAGRHLVTPMLEGNLSDPGFRDRLPADFLRYVTLMHERNRERNRSLRQQLKEIAAILNPIGVEPLLLKGGVRLVDDLYPCIGWRFMRDLDIMVARDRLAEARACLEGRGYRFTARGADWPEQHHHLPPLFRAGASAVIELHGALLSRHRELCPEADALARSTPVDLDGTTVRIPTAADQLAHLIGHDLTDGYLHHSSMLHLRSLFEAALLCRDRSAPQAVLARSKGGGATSGVRVALGLAARFFPDEVGALPDDSLGVRLRIHRLGALERIDESGRLRRFLWFSRLRLSKLLRRPDERRHLISQLFSPGYYQRCARRLHRLWVSD